MAWIFRWAKISGIFVSAVFLSVQSGIAGPYKQVRDWHVSCTNALSCTMSVYPEGDKLYTFGFERGPEASAPLRIFLSSGLTINEESDIVATIDSGDPVVYLEIPKAELMDGAWRFSNSEQARQLLDFMMAGSEMKLAIEAAEGDAAYPVTLSGVTAAALYMDEVQNRVGNQDALKGKGAGKPVPATTRVAEYSRVSELPDAVARFWNNGSERCGEGSEPSEDLIERFGATSVDLQYDSKMFILPCGLPGAYNMPQIILAFDEQTKMVRKLPLPVMGERGPTVMDYVYNTSWNDRGSELSAFFKGRGLGDCGSRQRWHIEGGYDANFELIEERIKSDCDGNYDEWPKIWPNK